MVEAEKVKNTIEALGECFAADSFHWQGSSRMVLLSAIRMVNAASNVTGFTFDFQQMPVAVKDLCGKPMYIQNADILNSESKVVVPVTKVVSFMNIGAAQPSADNPFGNLMKTLKQSRILNFAISMTM